MRIAAILICVSRHFHIDILKIIKNINSFKLKIIELVSSVIIFDIRNARVKFRQMRGIISNQNSLLFNYNKQIIIYRLLHDICKI